MSKPQQGKDTQKLMLKVQSLEHFVRDSKVWNLKFGV